MFLYLSEHIYFFVHFIQKSIGDNAAYSSKVNEYRAEEFSVVAAYRVFGNSAYFALALFNENHSKLYLFVVGELSQELVRGTLINGVYLVNAFSRFAVGNGGIGAVNVMDRRFGLFRLFLNGRFSGLVVLYGLIVSVILYGVVFLNGRFIFRIVVFQIFGRIAKRRVV